MRRTVDRLGYVPGLDGLRGVAIALVVAFHATGWPYGGPYGVDLFFVLSGFLITTLLLEERDRDGRVNLGRFYARRARRLFPAVGAMLGAYLVYNALRGHDAAGDVARWGLYFGNVYFVVHHFHDVTGLGHLWSLAEEEQFYVVWPAALLLIVRARRPIRWVLALVAAAAAWRFWMIAHGAPMDRMYRAPDTHAEGLLLGCALGFVRRAGYQGREWHAKLAVGLVAPAVVLGIWAVLLPAVEVGSALMILAAIAETEFARMLSAKPIVWLGTRSYSLYVWHFPILWAFAQDGIPLCVGASVLCAELSYRFVEQPFRRRRRAGTEAAIPAAAAAQ